MNSPEVGWLSERKTSKTNLLLSVNKELKIKVGPKMSIKHTPPPPPLGGEGAWGGVKFCGPSASDGSPTVFGRIFKEFLFSGYFI